MNRLRFIRDREDLLGTLDREPFVPLRLLFSSGGRYDILDPHAAALLKSEVFVVFPDGERWAHAPFLHIASIETIANGRGRNSKSRKR